MKRTLIAISVACVGTLVAIADEDNSTPAPYETLVFGTNNWFEAKANGSSPSYVGGSITQGEFKVEGEALAFDSKDIPVVFLSNDSYTQELSTVSLDVTASTVPNGKRALAEDKIAVALYESEKNMATNFVARAGGEWFDLVGAAVPYEGDDYTLLVRFDNRAEGRKVAFAWVDAEGVEYPLTNATPDSAWFNEYTVNFKTNQQMNVGFLGKGFLNNLKGFQLNIFASVTPTTNGTVVISKKDFAAFEKDPVVEAAGGVDNYMKSEAAETYKDKGMRFQKGISVAQAYALGLIKTVEGRVEVVNDGAIEVKAASASLTSGGLKVNFIGITPNKSTGATFNFKLFGSSDGRDWTDLEIQFTSVDAIYIPTSQFGANHFFKVVTDVLLQDAPAPQDK